MTYVALVLAAALIGCGDGSAQDSSTTTSRATTTTTSGPCIATFAPESPTGDEIFIEVESPQDGAEIEQATARFEGRTLPGATVVTGQQRVVSENGTWCLEVPIGPTSGERRVVLTAVDEAGDEATETVQVFYRPPVVTTSSEPSP
jgi:hypothetical protein